MRLLVALAAFTAALAGALREPEANAPIPKNFCGGNCPQGNCPTCPCGNMMQTVNVTDWCAQYPDWDQSCCACIMNFQSGGSVRQTTYNSDGSYSVGIAQVNTRDWPSCSNGDAPCTADLNLQCAISEYAWGNSVLETVWPEACSACGCCPPPPPPSSSTTSHSHGSDPLPPSSYTKGVAAEAGPVGSSFKLSRSRRSGTLAGSRRNA